MKIIRLYDNLNKHASNYDSILGLHPASWTITVIEPPIQINIYGIVNMLYTSEVPVIITSHAQYRS
jgi:hypothetical protein